MYSEQSEKESVSDRSNGWECKKMEDKSSRQAPKLVVKPIQEGINDNQNYYEFFVEANPK